MQRRHDRSVGQLPVLSCLQEAAAVIADFPQQPGSLRRVSVSELRSFQERIASVSKFFTQRSNQEKEFGVLVPYERHRAALLVLVATACRQQYATGFGAESSCLVAQLEMVCKTGILNTSVLLTSRALRCKVDTALLVFATKLLRMHTLQAYAQRLAEAVELLQRLQEGERDVAIGPHPPRSLSQQPQHQQQQRSQQDASTLHTAGLSSGHGRENVRQHTYGVVGCFLLLLESLFDLSFQLATSQHQLDPQAVATFTSDLSTAVAGSAVLEHAARVLLLLLADTDDPTGAAQDQLGRQWPRIFLAMTAHYRRAIEHDPSNSLLQQPLAGRCLQTALLAYGLAPLCAADGGPSYGLAQSLLSSIPLVGTDGTTDLRGSRGTQHLSPWPFQSLLAIIQPTVARPPLSRRRAHELALRVGRLAVASGRAAAEVTTEVARQAGKPAELRHCSGRHLFLAPRYVTELCLTALHVARQVTPKLPSEGGAAAAGGVAPWVAEAVAETWRLAVDAAQFTLQGASPEQLQEMGNFLWLEEAEQLCTGLQSTHEDEGGDNDGDSSRGDSGNDGSGDSGNGDGGRGNGGNGDGGNGDGGNGDGGSGDGGSDAVDTAPAPSVPPPRLVAALSGGLVGCLERLLRRAGHHCSVVSARDCSEGIILQRMLGKIGEVDPGDEDAAYTLLALLSCGEPQQAAALVMSFAKVLRRLQVGHILEFLVPERPESDTIYCILTVVLGVLCSVARRGGLLSNRSASACAMKGSCVATAASAGSAPGPRNADSDSSSSSTANGSSSSGNVIPLPAARASEGLVTATSGANPRRQLMLMSTLAAATWLPQLSRLARQAAMLALKPPVGLGEVAPMKYRLITAYILDPELFLWLNVAARRCMPGGRWTARQAGDAATVPATFTAAAGASVRVGAATEDDGGSRDADDWRRLLVEEVGVVPLLGAVLELFRLHLQDVLHKDVDVLNWWLLVASCCAVAVACPEEVRAAACASSSAVGGAGAGGCASMAAAHVPWQADVVRALVAKLEADGEAQHSIPGAIALAEQLEAWASAAAGDTGAGPGTGGGGDAGEGERMRRMAMAVGLSGTLRLGQLDRLSRALAPLAEARGLLRTCDNPACDSMAGDSEAALPLRACGGCGEVSYCCKDCQTAHWRAGHKEACAGGRRRGHT